MTQGATSRWRLPLLAAGGIVLTAACVYTVFDRFMQVAPSEPAEPVKPTEAAEPEAPEVPAETEVPVAPSTSLKPHAFVPPLPPKTQSSKPPEPKAVVEKIKPKPPAQPAKRPPKKITLTVRAADEDGDKLTFQWLQLEGPKVKIADPRTNETFFIASQPGVYVFEIVVSDGKAVTTAKVTRSVRFDDGDPAPGGF